MLPQLLLPSPDIGQEVAVCAAAPWPPFLTLPCPTCPQLSDTGFPTSYNRPHQRPNLSQLLPHLSPPPTTPATAHTQRPNLSQQCTHLAAPGRTRSAQAGPCNPPVSRRLSRLGSCTPRATPAQCSSCCRLAAASGARGAAPSQQRQVGSWGQQNVGGADLYVCMSRPRVML